MYLKLDYKEINVNEFPVSVKTYIHWRSLRRRMLGVKYLLRFQIEECGWILSETSDDNNFWPQLKNDAEGSSYDKEKGKFKESKVQDALKGR